MKHEAKSKIFYKNFQRQTSKCFEVPEIVIRLMNPAEASSENCVLFWLRKYIQEINGNIWSAVLYDAQICDSERALVPCMEASAVIL